MTTPTGSSVLRELSDQEAAVRRAAATDPDQARKLAADAAKAYGEAYARDPTDPRLAAGWLRCLRRSQASWDEVAPIVEAMGVRFAQNRVVCAAIAFLLLDRARERAAAGDLEEAAARIGEAIPKLDVLTEKSYVAMSLLGALRVFAEAVEERRNRQPEIAAPALEAVLDVLWPRHTAWIAAIPVEAAADAPATGETARPAMPPRERAWLLLRKLLRSAARWEHLGQAMREALEHGVRSEWCADAAVQALQESGRPQEALDLVHQLERRFPRSEVLARRRATLLMTTGRVEDGMRSLRETALASTSPWAWRDLALRLLEDGESDEGVQALRCALAYEDRRNPGTTWRLHLTLAQIFLRQGDEPGAALEIWLARDARTCSGWGLGKDLTEIIQRNAPRITPLLDELDARPVQEIRRRGKNLYRRALTEYRRRHAVPATVTDVRSSFGFLQLSDGTNRVFFPTSLVPAGRRLEPGDELRAIVVRSYDAKKRRDSLRAVWLELPGADRT